MNFLLAYQQRQLSSPLNQRGFDETNWSREYERLGTDDVDADLHRAGLMARKKCLLLWSMRYLPESGLNEVTKVRALLLAVSNHAAKAIVHRTRTALADRQDPGRVVVPLNQLNLKLEAPGGDFSPDELLQAVEVGARISIGDTLRAKGNANGSLTGNATFTKVNWSRLLVEFNLGTQFDNLREQWDDDWIVRYRVSSRRRDNLLLQFFHNSIEGLKEWPDAVLFAAAPRSVRQVSRRDGKYVIVFSEDRGSDRDDAIRWLATTSYAQEPYYRELLNRPRELLNGGTVDELMSAWTVVQSISEKLFEFDGATPDDRKPHAWIGEYVPIIDVTTIARAVSDATQIPMSRATAIVRFLTYSGAYHQELYGHPLVPVGKATVSPCLVAIHSPNILRLTDVWLRELGEELEQRGPAFEQYIRAHVAESASGSPLLSESASVLPDAMNFAVPGRRSEEIVELTRFRGHLSFGIGGACHGKAPRPLRAGISGADGRVGQSRPLARRACAGVRADSANDLQLGGTSRSRHRQTA